jgi:hypothetical protein
MNILIVVALVIVALGVAVAIVHAALVVLGNYRGPMSVTCPETRAPVGVEVDRNEAFITTLFGKPDLRLHDCTRWPEKRDCDQACISQIETSPVDCLVRTKLARWYQGKSCAICDVAFGEIDWHDHKPVLMSPSGELREWSSVRGDELPDVLETHKPVCWNCMIATSFVREHPDQVLFNPWQKVVREPEEELV